MSEFINFLQAYFKTIVALFITSGAALSVYLYNNRHYRQGSQTGKKIVNRLKRKIASILAATDFQKDTLERINEIKDIVFQTGFSGYIEGFNKTVSRLGEQINSLKKELEDRKEAMSKDNQEKDKKLEEKIHELETILTVKEKELLQLKREENEKNEVLEQRNKVKNQNRYFFSELSQKVQKSLSEVIKKLEADTLNYLNVIIIIFLLLGDYYISYFIFSDILKIQFRNNQIAIYIFSGIIALVFLVLTDRVMDLLEKSTAFKKYLKKIQTISVIVVALILLIIYLLMVSLSWLNDNNIPGILDSLLRLLFVPLIIAVAITIRKIQKEGGFSFIFSPVKVVLYLISIMVFNVLLVLEVILDFIHRYLQKENFESKTKFTIAEEVENIKVEIANNSNSRKILKQQLGLEIDKLTEQYQRSINKSAKKLDLLNSEMAKIREGCERGVVTSLPLVG